MSAGARSGSVKKEQTHAKLLSALTLADTQRVLDGAVENYLSVGCADPLLSRSADASEWLSFADVTNAEQFNKGASARLDSETRVSPIATAPLIRCSVLCSIAVAGHFALMPYADFAVLAVHEQWAAPIQTPAR